MTTGTNRVFVRTSSRLFEFDQTGKYVREIGHGLYAFVQAHAVRIDPQDNIWVVDEGSNMVVKFDPEGRVVMTLGRKPEAIENPVRPAAGPAAPSGPGFPGDNLQWSVRRGVGRCWRYFRSRWFRALESRQIRQEWRISQNLGRQRGRAGTIQHSSFDRG